MALLEQTVDVHVAPEAAYGMWMRFEDYPHFMEGVVQVRRGSSVAEAWAELERRGGAA